MTLTKKAIQLLYKLEKQTGYSMSCMGDLIFEENKYHSRQTIALKASRFARQLQDLGFVKWNPKTRLYYLTQKGINARFDSI